MFLVKLDNPKITFEDVAGCEEAKTPGAGEQQADPAVYAGEIGHSSGPGGRGG